MGSAINGSTQFNNILLGVTNILKHMKWCKKQALNYLSTTNGSIGLERIVHLCNITTVVAPYRILPYQLLQPGALDPTAHLSPF